MGDITVTAPDGTKGTIPDTPQQRQLAQDHGFKVDEGVLHSIGEAARGADEAISAHPVVNYNPLTWVEHAGLKGIAALGGAKTRDELAADKQQVADADAEETARTGQAPVHQVTVVSPDGQTGTIPNTPEQLKLAEEHGFKQVDAVDAGPRGAARSYLENVGNQLFMGAPGMVASQDEKDANAALDKAHPYAAGAGTVAGAVAGGAMAGEGGGGEARTLAAKLLARAGAQDGSVLARAGAAAAEGIAVSSPAAAKAALVDEDPTKGAEMLLGGGLIGAAFGAAGGLASKAGKLMTAAADDAAEARAAANVAKAAGEEVPAAEPSVTSGLLGKAAGKAAKYGISAIGAHLGGPLGAVVAHQVGDKVEKAIDNPELRTELWAKAAQASYKGIAGVGGALEDMAGSEAPAGATTVGLWSLAGTKPDAPIQEQWDKSQQRLNELGADLTERASRTAHLATVATEGLDGHPAQAPLSDAVTQATERIHDYLTQQAPKQPAPQPFQKESPWMPSPAQLMKYQTQVQVALDPFSAIRDMQRGTLTQTHVDALQSMYPQLLQAMRDQVTKAAADPKAPELPRSMRDQVSILMGQPIDKDPGATSFYQQQYAAPPPQQPQPGGKKGGGPSTRKMPSIPSTLPSQTDRITYGLPRPKAA